MYETLKNYTRNQKNCINLIYKVYKYKGNLAKVRIIIEHTMERLSGSKS